MANCAQIFILSELLRNIKFAVCITQTDLQWQSFLNRYNIITEQELKPRG